MRVQNGGILENNFKFVFDILFLYKLIAWNVSLLTLQVIVLEITKTSTKKEKKKYKEKSVLMW